MISPIVESARAVTLVGGGKAKAKALHKALSHAPLCVAADGGAHAALAAGADVAALIGDFDSVTDAALSQIPTDRQHRIADQDSTDFEKALRRIAAPVVLGVGFLGGRIDHQLAVFHALAMLPDRPCILIGKKEVICLAPPQIDLPTEAGEVVSLFPMQPVTGKSTGLFWPIDGLQFGPTQQIGTSNRAEGTVSLHMDGPGMLLILPERLMPALLSHFEAPDVARWPAL